MMSRTGRLFQLMDALRGNRRPVTAAVLAEQLGVSERTIYRDMRTLAELGAPLEGEAGVGYMLRAGFFLPPLMFGADELEALVLGARWVKRQGDAELSRAAASALAKIATATPKDLRDEMAETSLWVPMGLDQHASDDPHIQPARVAIRRQHKLRLSYCDEHGRTSERVVWPFALAYLEGRRLLAAWCELRSATRHFRIDRIRAVDTIAERYPTPRHALLKAWRAENHIREDA
jgi:predicted DNA-binding transcriptional regulator YafY